MSVRADILSITEEKLVQIANMGLVKRAKKAIGKGDVPSFSLADDQTLTVTFADDNTLSWKPNQGLADSQCTCPASMCRHRVQAVLAYRELNDNPEVSITSPHLITTDQLQTFTHTSLTKQASTLCQHGISARIQPTAENNKCPTVQLPMATIRFWGGDNLHEATCDCIQKQHCEHILLAGCAYSLLADEPTGATSVQLSKKQLLTLLGKTKVPNNLPSNVDASNAKPDDKQAESQPSSTPQKYQAIDTTKHLTQAEMALFAELLQHGITSGATRYARLMDDVRTELTNAKAIWLQAVLDDLSDWLDAYQNRRSDFEPEQGLNLVAEYVLRTLARNNTAYVAGALGVGVKQETPIATARLASLGCQIKKIENTFTTHTMLIDQKSATMMLYKHEWQENHDDSQVQTALAQQVQTSPEQKAKKIANQRISARINLAQLATGQLTCQRAKRMANHEIKLNRSRSAYNQVLPQQANWAALGTVVYDNIERLLADRKNRPIAPLRGRYGQPDFHIVQIKHIIEHGYNPATQSYVVIAEDDDGSRFVVKRTHRAHVPFAIEAMAQAFSQVQVGSTLQNCFVAGEVTMHSGFVLINPWAVVTDKLYVPDVYLPDNYVTADNVSQSQKKPISALSKSPLVNFDIPDNSQDSLLSSIKQLNDILSQIIHFGVNNHKLDQIRQLYQVCETQGFADLSELISNINTQGGLELSKNLLQLISNGYLYLKTDNSD